MLKKQKPRMNHLRARLMNTQTIGKLETNVSLVSANGQYIDQSARQTLAFMPGKESADGAGIIDFALLLYKIPVYETPASLQV